MTKHVRTISLLCFIIPTALILTMLCSTEALSAAHSKKPVKRIGLVLDGPARHFDYIVERIKYEINRLLINDYQVEYPENLHFSGDFTIATINSALQDIISRKELDLLITIGPVSTWQASRIKALPRPVIGSIILDSKAQKVPYADGTSGKPNFVYIEVPDTFSEDIRSLEEITGFKNLAILAGHSLLSAIPGAEHGLRFKMEVLQQPATLLNVSRSARETLAEIPDEIDAIYLLPTPEIESSELQKLLDGFIERKLPVFAFTGESVVKKGALAGLTPNTWFSRVSRRIGLNALRIFSGRKAESIPVSFSRESQLFINMKTARAIGAEPNFSVLSEAVLINKEKEDIERRLTLSGTMKEALENNLDILAKERILAAGEADIDQVRAKLLPQINVLAIATQIDEDRADSPFGAAERTTTGSLSATQILWSEAAWSNLDVQQSVQAAQVADFDRLRLDVALEATQAYIDVLRASTRESVLKSNLKLSRSNLERARVRASIGAGGVYEVYRWESKIAQERSEVVKAIAQTRIAEINLNRLLNRPLEEPFLLEDTSLENSVSLILDARLSGYLNTESKMKVFREFLVVKGQSASPELLQIRANIKAARRSLDSAKRAYYSPDLSLSTEVSHLMDESGKGSGGGSGSSIPGLGDDPDDTDWNISLSLNFPLFKGGGKKAERTRAFESLKELNIQQNIIGQQIHQTIRSSVHSTGASYTGIKLSQASASAAAKSLEIVTDSYSRGVVNLIDLLDAQTTSLQAELSSADAVYLFLKDLLSLERAVGSFTFLATEEEKRDWIEDLESYFELREKS